MMTNKERYKQAFDTLHFTKEIQLDKEYPLTISNFKLQRRVAIVFTLMVTLLVLTTSTYAINQYKDNATKRKYLLYETEIKNQIQTLMDIPSQNIDVFCPEDKSILVALFNVDPIDEETKAEIEKIIEKVVCIDGNNLEISFVYFNE